jgi:ornithine cyclodeaminase
VQNGVIGWDKIVEIADILAGKAPGRTDDQQIILYKNQGGQGIIDIALAKRLYELARERGFGTELPIRSRPSHTGTGWRDSF